MTTTQDTGWHEDAVVYSIDVNIFPNREDGVWTYDDVAQKHYFHQFYGHQPDLDVANPAVQAEMFDVLRFWIDQGAGGCRVEDDSETFLLEPCDYVWLDVTRER